MGASEYQRSSMNTSKMESVLNKELREADEEAATCVHHTDVPVDKGARRLTLKASSVLTDKEAEMIVSYYLISFLNSFLSIFN